MKHFDEVIGNDDIKKYMKACVTYNKMAHAYIISGESGSGKTMLTNLFVKAILCENIQNSEMKEPCGICMTCVKIDGNNHPDVITLQQEKKEIAVGEIRTQINNDIEIKPYSASKKIYIIPSAEKMNQQAQNALLKTIEEPPNYAIIILQAISADALLQTIQSRCVELSIKRVSDTKVVDYLLRTESISEYEAKVCAAFAKGNIGKAIKIAQSNEFGEIKKFTINVITNIKNCRQDAFNVYVKQSLEYKEQINECFEIIYMWIRDVYVYKSTANLNMIVLQENAVHIKQFANEISYNGLEKIIKAVETAKERIRANVGFEMVMELLFRSIKES